MESKLSVEGIVELKGMDKIKEGLNEIEVILDRVIEKYERVAALEGQVQAQPKKIEILIDAKVIANSVVDGKPQSEKIDTTILYAK